MISEQAASETTFGLDAAEINEAVTQRFRERATLGFALATWPVMAFFVLGLSALFCVLFWPFTQLTRRRNQGEDDAIPFTDEVALVWIPALSVTGSLGITVAFTLEGPQRWVCGVSTCLGVAVLAYLLARQVVDHRSGESVAVYSPEVPATEALEQLLRLGYPQSFRWLPMVARQAITETQDRAKADRCSAKTYVTKTTHKAPALRPVPAFFSVLGQACETLVKRHWLSACIALAWVIVFGFLGVLSFCKNGPSSDLTKLLIVVFVMLCALPTLGVMTYLTHAFDHYQWMMRGLTLADRVATAAAEEMETPAAIQTGSSGPSSNFRSPLSRALVRLATKIDR